MRIQNLACLSAALCTVAALAQVTTERTLPIEDSTEASSTSPVAYIYVSSLIANNKAEIVAYSAASTGKLTPIPGSPFAGDVSYLASNGKYLFGSTLSSTDIDAYTIESNGALHYTTSTNVVSPDGGCGEAGEIFTDHSGTTLYDMAYFGNECTNNTYEQFTIQKTTGKLTFIGDAGDNEEINGRLSFIADNDFGYSSDCYHDDAAIYGFKRSSTGKLTGLNIDPALPKAPSNTFYCPWMAVADTSNHLAISLQALSDDNQENVGPAVLATYTAASSGSLTTTSTSSNMPKTLVGNVVTMNMAPSGKLLAVAGSKGLQVFHFNGAGPITTYTSLLTTSQVDQIFWDNSNHLYAIGSSAKKLWVFTVTPTSHSQASGSPYTVDTPEGLKVLPL